MHYEAVVVTDFLGMSTRTYFVQKNVEELLLFWTFLLTLSYVTKMDDLI